MDTKSPWFKYLTNDRQLSPEVIKEAQLREELGRLKIPVFDEAGNELFAKLRRPQDSDIGPKYMYQKGATASLYGTNFSDLGGPIYYTEGELEVLAMRSVGLMSFSSTGGAMTFRKEWLEHKAEREKIILFDNDDTGLKGAVKLALMLGVGGYTWVPPVYGKDVGDLLQKLEPVQVMKLLTDEERIVRFDIRAESKTELKKFKTVLYDQAQTREHDMGKRFLLELSAAIHQLTKIQKKKVRHQNVDNAIERARAYPIENLMPFQSRKAKCLWHNEKTASLHLYPDNHLFCHGSCDRPYDAIDVYMKLHNMTFMEAVNELARL